MSTSRSQRESPSRRSRRKCKNIVAISRRPVGVTFAFAPRRFEAWPVHLAFEGGHRDGAINISYVAHRCVGSLAADDSPRGDAHDIGQGREEQGEPGDLRE